jgi:hypothetical protein
MFLGVPDRLLLGAGCVSFSIIAAFGGSSQKLGRFSRSDQQRLILYPLKPFPNSQIEAGRSCILQKIRSKERIFEYVV